MPKTAERRGSTRAAARNLGWLLSSKGLGAVLGLLYLGLTTRALGPLDFGRFALITGASQAIVTFVAFPTWQIIIQYGVAHQIRGDEAALGRLFRTAALLDCCAALLGALIVALVLGLFGASLGIGSSLLAYVAMFSIVQLITLRSTPLGMLRLRDDYARAAWADSTTSIVRTIGTIIALIASPTVAGFLAAWALAEVATAAAFWRFVARDGDLGRLWRARIDRLSVARDNPGLLRFAVSTNANVTLGLSEKQIPLLLVGHFVGPAAAGGFRLAFQIAQALSKLAQMLTRAAFPELVHAVRRKPAGKVSRLLVRILLASTGAALAILVLVVAVGKPILVLVGGTAYGAAFPLLVWLAAAGCLDLATVGFEPVLMALHRAGTAFIVRVIAAAIMVVASWTLTGRYGALGAALALLVGTIAAEAMIALITFRAVAQMPPETRIDDQELGGSVDPV